MLNIKTTENNELLADSADCAGFAGIRRSPSLLGLEHILARLAVTGSAARASASRWSL
jgi:hypothetical protein